MENQIAIDEEKQWAVGMKQPEFEQEYQRRYPYADVFPDVNTWVGTKSLQYRGITPILPEMMVEDNPEFLQKKEEEQKPKVYYCKGCGKEGKVKAGIMRHEKFCDAAKNVRTITVKDNG